MIILFKRKYSQNNIITLPLDGIGITYVQLESQETYIFHTIFRFPLVIRNTENDSKIDNIF